LCIYIDYVFMYVCMYVCIVILNMVRLFFQKRELFVYQALEEAVVVITLSTAIEQDLVTDNLSLTEF